MYVCVYIYIYIYTHTYIQSRGTETGPKTPSAWFWPAGAARHQPVCVIYIEVHKYHLPPNNKLPPPFQMTFVGGSIYEGGNRRLGPPILTPPFIKDPPLIIASKCPSHMPIAFLKLFV